MHLFVSSGGWEGQAHFKMSFPSGGAIELGQHLFKLATNGWCSSCMNLLCYSAKCCMTLKSSIAGVGKQSSVWQWKGVWISSRNLP